MNGRAKFSMLVHSPALTDELLTTTDEVTARADDR